MALVQLQLQVRNLQVRNDVISATSLCHACHLCGAQQTPFCLSAAASLLVLVHPHKIRIGEFPSSSGLTRVLLPLSCCVSSSIGSQNLLFFALSAFTDLRSAAPVVSSAPSQLDAGALSISSLCH